jgi:hypothetical protein
VLATEEEEEEEEEEEADSVASGMGARAGEIRAWRRRWLTTRGRRLPKSGPWLGGKQAMMGFESRHRRLKKRSASYVGTTRLCLGLHPTILDAVSKSAARKSHVSIKQVSMKQVFRSSSFATASNIDIQSPVFAQILAALETRTKILHPRVYLLIL